MNYLEVPKYKNIIT